MSQEDIILAEMVRPGDVKPQPAEPPVKSRYGAMAVLSAILPFLTMAAGVFLVLTSWNMRQFWFSWAMLGLMLLQGFAISIVPLRANPGRRNSIVKQFAMAGLVFNLMALIFALGCVFVASSVTYVALVRIPAEKEKEAAAQANTPEARQARAEKAARDDQRRERLEQQRLEAAEAERLREEFMRQREAALTVWDEEVASRFQQGPSEKPLPVVPTGYEFTAEYVPAVRNRPLQFSEHEVTVTEVDRELLTDEPFSVDDITVQPLSLIEWEDLEDYRRLKRDWLNMTWDTQQDTSLIYLVYGSQLWEIDTSNWRVKREVELGGTGLSIVWCHSGIAIALKDQGLILVLDPQTLQTQAAVPVAGIQEVVGSRANDRLFVRMNFETPYTLASINLETRSIEYLLQPERATRLGNESNPESVLPEFLELHVTADGKHLLAIEAHSYRWSVAENGELTCVELGIITRSPVPHSASPDGRRVLDHRFVFDISDTIYSPLVQCPDLTRLQWGSITNDGLLFTHLPAETNLTTCDAQGNIIAEYVWLDQEAPNHEGETMWVYTLPDPGQLLVDTQSGWYVVRLPETSPSEP